MLTSRPKYLHPTLDLAHVALAAEDLLQRVQQIEQPLLALPLSREPGQARRRPINMLLDTFRVLGLPPWVAVVGCRGITVLGLGQRGLSGCGMRIDGACISTD